MFLTGKYNGYILRFEGFPAGQQFSDGIFIMIEIIRRAGNPVKVFHSETVVGHSMLGRGTFQSDERGPSGNVAGFDESVWHTCHPSLQLFDDIALFLKNCQ